MCYNKITEKCVTIWVILIVNQSIIRIDEIWSLIFFFGILDTLTNILRFKKRLLERITRYYVIRFRWYAIWYFDQ